MNFGFPQWMSEIWQIVNRPRVLISSRSLSPRNSRRKYIRAYFGDACVGSRSGTIPVPQAPSQLAARVARKEDEWQDHAEGHAQPLQVAEVLGPCMDLAGVADRLPNPGHQRPRVPRGCSERCDRRADCPVQAGGSSNHSTDHEPTQRESQEHGDNVGGPAKGVVQSILSRGHPGPLRDEHAVQARVNHREYEEVEQDRDHERYADPCDHTQPPDASQRVPISRCRSCTGSSLTLHAGGYKMATARLRFVNRQFDGLSKVHIFSGAFTPRRSRPAASTVLVAAHSASRRVRTSSSSTSTRCKV